MSLRLMLGGKRHHEDHEAEARRRARSHHDDDMDMRRRPRSYYDDDEMDMRRGRPRSHHDDDMDMRRRTRGAEDAFYPWMDNPHHMYMPHHHYMPEHERRIGFDGRRDEMDELRAEMHHLKHEHEKLKKGYASFKELAPNMEGVLEDAAHLIHNPPETWSAYMKRGDLAGIARMETKELVAALEVKRPPKELRKEFVHTIAALMQLAEE